MPTPLPHVIQSPSIKLDKDDLTNRSQYTSAAEMIAGRMISTFGLTTFFLYSISMLRRCIRVTGDMDHRTRAVKQLTAAEDALMEAAKAYDDAVQAVRNSFTKGKKR